MSTHRQMVKVGPNHCAMMTRDALEAHLTLQGWNPCAWGIAGAYKPDGNPNGECIVVYGYHSQPFGERKFTSEWGRAAKDTAKRHIDTAGVGWFMSDDLFWPIVHIIMDIEACQHESVRSADGKSNGFPVRCTQCHLMVDL